MNYWSFTSAEEWFSLMLPGNWEEYDEEDDGTYSFLIKNNGVEI